jgi:hypothetical protein
MALDFPANPTNGQVFGSYIWSSAKSAWQAKEESAAPAVVSPVPPTTSNTGDIWVDSSDGIAYVYYNDGTSGQWIEMISSGVVSLASKANLSGGNIFLGTQTFDTPVAISSGGTGANSLSGAQTNLQIQTSPNYLINGAFDFWQRGTSFTSTSYGPDRWWLPISGGTTSQETADLPPGFQYGVRYTTSGASQFGQFNQPIETAQVIRLRGKTVTLSGYIKITGSYTGNWISQALYSTSTDAYASQTTLVPGSNKNVANSATTSWTRFSNTFVVPSDAMGLRIENIPDSVQPSGVTIRMTGIQLEEGSVATPFRRNQANLDAEFQACQRYYYQIVRQNGSSSWAALPIGWTPTATSLEMYMHLPQLRTTPTLEVSAASHFVEQRTGAVPTSVSLGTGGWSTGRMAVIVFALSSMVAGGAGNLRSNNTGAFLALSAEL